MHATATRSNITFTTYAIADGLQVVENDLYPTLDGLADIEGGWLKFESYDGAHKVSGYLMTVHELFEVLAARMR